MKAKKSHNKAQPIDEIRDKVRVSVAQTAASWKTVCQR